MCSILLRLAASGIATTAIAGQGSRIEGQAPPARWHPDTGGEGGCLTDRPFVSSWHLCPTWALFPEHFHYSAVRTLQIRAKTGTCSEDPGPIEQVSGPRSPANTLAPLGLYAGSLTIVQYCEHDDEETFSPSVCLAPSGAFILGPPTAYYYAAPDETSASP
ncbi:hypothetical protein PG988_013620 [Apiospora saccharicola]